MAKSKVIDFTLSDSDSDGDFIQQAKKVKVARAQVSAHVCLAVNKLLLYDVEL